jgi:hypothetical protein
MKNINYKLPAPHPPLGSNIHLRILSISVRLKVLMGMYLKMFWDLMLSSVRNLLPSSSGKFYPDD